MKGLQLLYAFIPVLFTACGEPKSSLDITFYSEPEELYLPGNSLRIHGIVTDEVNLKNVSIRNSLMRINQNYEIESSKQEHYEFDFLYVLPESLFASKYDLILEAENTKGQIAQATFTIDFAKIPQFIDTQTLYSAIKGETVTLQGTLVDEQGLSEYRLVCLDLALFLDFPIADEPQQYAMDGTFIMPDWPVAGQYTAILFAYNKRQLVNTINDIIIEVRNP